MVEYWTYIGKMTLPADVPTDVKDEWANTLAGEMSRIYTNLTSKIPNQDAFTSRLATPASDRYSDFLASTGDGWNAAIIKLKHKIKLGRAYSAWSNGIGAAFGGTNPYFDDRVLEKKAKYGNAKYVLAGVGLKYDVSGFGCWRPIVKGVLFLRGDKRPMNYLTADESFSGTLHSTLDAVKGRLVTPSIISHAVYAVVMAWYAHEAGETSTRDTILSNANTMIANFINLAKDTTHSGSGYQVNYTLSWDTAAGKPKLTVQDIHP